MYVYIVNGDAREKTGTLGVYSSERKAIKRAAAHIHNQNRELDYVREDYKKLSARKFYEKYCSLWLVYATVQRREVR